MGLGLTTGLPAFFKYSTKEGVIGVEEEYFYNPHGATVRTVDQNWETHQEIIEKGESESE